MRPDWRSEAEALWRLASKTVFDQERADLRVVSDDTINDPHVAVGDLTAPLKRCR